MELEHLVQCPACWEMHSVLADPVEGEQVFVEDCSVCCRPMTIRVVMEGEEVTNIQVDTAD